MKLMGYLPTGYPSIKDSMKMAELYLQGGCDGIEMSIPYADPKLEPVHVAAGMLYSLWKNDNYEDYMGAICDFKQKYPDAYTFNLVSADTINSVGIDRYFDFFRKSGMKCLLGIGLDDEIKGAAKENGIGLSASVSCRLLQREINYALSLKKGIVYMTYKGGSTDPFKEGYETVASRVKYVRDAGITLPIFCGVGIRTAEDIREIREAGADGAFLGSSLMKNYDNPKLLLETIEELREAAHG